MPDQRDARPKPAESDHPGFQDYQSATSDQVNGLMEQGMQILTDHGIAVLIAVSVVGLGMLLVWKMANKLVLADNSSFDQLKDKHIETMDGVQRALRRGEEVAAGIRDELKEHTNILKLNGKAIDEVRQVTLRIEDKVNTL